MADANTDERKPLQSSNEENATLGDVRKGTMEEDPSLIQPSSPVRSDAGSTISDATDFDLDTRDDSPGEDSNAAEVYQLATESEAPLFAQHSVVQENASISCGEIRFQSIRRRNPLYRPSMKVLDADMRNSVLHCGACKLLAVTHSTSTHNDMAVPAATADKIKSKIPLEKKTLVDPNVVTSMTEEERLEVLHNVRLGSISVEDAMVLAAARSDVTKLSLHGHSGRILKSPIPTPLSPGDVRRQDDFVSGKAALIRSGQWTDMAAILRKSVLHFEDMEGENELDIAMCDTTHVSVLENVPTDGSKSVEVVDLSQAPDVIRTCYMFATTDEETSKWETAITKQLAAVAAGAVDPVSSPTRDEESASQPAREAARNAMPVLPSRSSSSSHSAGEEVADGDANHDALLPVQRGREGAGAAQAASPTSPLPPIPHDRSGTAAIGDTG